MRIVIIGGLGLIGRAFSEMAAAKGHELFLLTRRESSKQEKNDNIEIQQWDGKDPEKLSHLIENTDVLINVAGESIGKGKWTQQRKSELLNSRLEPARALVKAFSLCKKPPKTLVQASAVGIYGTGEDVKTEASTTGNDYLAKFAGEWEESTKQVEQMGTRRIIIRTGIVLDRNQGVLPQLMLPFILMVGGPVGSGKQVYSWIHIKDEAAAILYLIEKSTCAGVYNLTAPKPLQNNEIGKVLARVMNRPYWMPVPGFALKLVLGEMSTLVLDGQKVLPERLLEEGYHFLYPNLEGALIDLLHTN
jgi:uncharacterized protein (TIGR01777 family)